MTEEHAKGATVTFTPIYKGRYMFVQRHLDDEFLAGYWCFPGGRVHVGETLVGALVRELKEETGLTPTGRLFFVDSYLIGDRVGAHFAVEVTHDDVSLQELHDHVWVESVADLADYSPRIKGIDSHLSYIVQRLKTANELSWHRIEDLDLIKQRFLNKS
jgi:8-oxo-dGTP diphosphatase